MLGTAPTEELEGSLREREEILRAEAKRNIGSLGLDRSPTAFFNGLNSGSKATEKRLNKNDK